MKIRNIVPVSLAVIILFTAFTSNINAQTNTPERPNIVVTGSAEKEVIPNEIYLTITLKEFMDGKDKVTLEKLEKQLIKAVTAAGIDATQLGLSDLNSQFTNFKRKKTDVFEQRVYQLKIVSVEKMTAFFNGIQNIEIYSINVERFSHTDIEAFRKEVKMAAAKAAKDKAGYLLEAMGAKVGQPLEVIELDNNVYTYNRLSNVALYDSFGEQEPSYSEIEFKPIIIRYEIKAKFAIE